MKRLLVAIAFIALMGLVPAGRAAADDKDSEDKLQAKPFVFVGSAADCGGTAGSNIVTAAWLRGMGLPDDGGNNAPNPSIPGIGRRLKITDETATRARKASADQKGAFCGVIIARQSSQKGATRSPATALVSRIESKLQFTVQSLINQ